MLRPFACFLHGLHNLHTCCSTLSVPPFLLIRLLSIRTIASYSFADVIIRYIPHEKVGHRIQASAQPGSFWVVSLTQDLNISGQQEVHVSGHV